MLTRKKVTEILRKELPYLRSTYGVKRIGIFGSFAKGIQRRRSDVDIIVELKKPLGLKFVELADYLEDILDKRVDITTLTCFKNSFRNPRDKHIAEDVKRSLIYV